MTYDCNMAILAVVLHLRLAVLHLKVSMVFFVALIGHTKSCTSGRHNSLFCHIGTYYCLVMIVLQVIQATALRSVHVVTMTYA